MSPSGPHHRPEFCKRLDKRNKLLAELNALDEEQASLGMTVGDFPSPKPDGGATAVSPAR